MYLRSVVDVARQETERLLAQGKYEEAAGAGLLLEQVIGDGSGKAIADHANHEKKATLLRTGDEALARGDQPAAKRAWDELAALDALFPGVGERIARLPLGPGDMKRFAPSNASFAYIPAGTFQMGCVPLDEECGNDEKPQHMVTVSHGYWMKVTLVTVAEYQMFASATLRGLPATPGFPQDGNHPVVNVTWGDAVAYCRWAGGRLSTEAEWEYAARGGRDALKYPWGDTVSHDDANFDGIGGRDRWKNTSPVGSFAANGFGLVDMAGNVWEWCADWYDLKAYASSPAADPQGPSSGLYRAVRGGSWVNYPKGLRVSVRDWLDPTSRYDYSGFRCVRDK